MNVERPSLFNDHLDIIEGRNLTDLQLIEKDRIESFKLPSLQFPPEQAKNRSEGESLKDKILELFMTPIVQGGLVAALSLTLVVNLLLQKNQDHLIAKGSVRVSYLFERDGKVQAMTETTVLQSGDKLGVNVISSKDAVAYWTIVNHNNENLLSSADVLQSRIELKAGVKNQFASSFTLTDPNEGENLIVIVCEVNSVDSDVVDNVMDHSFVSKTLAQNQIKAQDCMYVGRRLRKLEAK